LVATGSGFGPRQVNSELRDGVFTLDVSRDRNSLSFVSPIGEHMNDSGLPTRCGLVPWTADPQRYLGYEPVAEGATSKLQIDDGSGSGPVHVIASNLALLEHNPRGLRGLATDEVFGSIFVSPPQLTKLVSAGPGDETTLSANRHHWSFGLVTETSAHGSLDQGFSYRFDMSAGGAHSGVDSYGLAGFSCNGPTGLASRLGDVVYHPVLLTAGVSLEVDRVPVEESVYEPLLQARWVVARVPVGKHREAVTIDADGKELSRWQMRTPAPD
jgi:hypothetical protein